MTNLAPYFRRLGFRGLGVYALIMAAGSGATLLAVRARAAGVPDPASALTYTGYLEDGAGAPLTGKHTVAVNFWADQMMSAKALCTGKLAATADLQAGRFQVPLPKDCVDAVNANPNIWVDVEVDGASLGATALGAVPYALQAGSAVSSDHVAVVTPWKADPNAAFIGYSNAMPFSNQTTTSSWRRVGDSIDVQITTAFSGVPGNGAGALAWSLPSGVKEDQAKLDRAKNGPTGHAYAYFSPGKVQVCTAYMAGDLLHLLIDCGTGNADVDTSQLVAGSEISIRMSLPVVGWSD